jgi:hypothetical protein
VRADDALTTGDWQHLRSIGYEEQSSALERSSTKGQTQVSPQTRSGISAKKRMDLIGSYLTAIGIGTVPK